MYITIDNILPLDEYHFKNTPIICSLCDDWLASNHKFPMRLGTSMQHGCINLDKLEIIIIG